MDNTYISRAEHEEFCKRIEEENHRQNKRIEQMENNVQQFGTLATSVEKLAVNMENMLKEQEKQGKRLETLEKRDGEKWRKVVETVITVIVSAVIGFALAHIGL